MKNLFTKIVCIIIIIIIGTYIYKDDEIANRDMIKLETLEADISNMDSFIVKGFVQSTRDKGQEFTIDQGKIDKNIIKIDPLNYSSMETLENKDFFRGTARYNRFLFKDTQVLVGTNNKGDETTLDIRYANFKEKNITFKRQNINKVYGEVKGSITEKLPELFLIDVFEYKEELYFIASIKSDYDDEKNSYESYSLVLLKVDFEKKALDMVCTISKLYGDLDYYHDVFIMNKDALENDQKLEVLSVVNFGAFSENTLGDKEADFNRYTIDLNDYKINTVTNKIKDQNIDFSLEEFLYNDYNSYGSLEDGNKFYIFYDNCKVQNTTVTFCINLDDNSLDIKKDPDVLSRQFKDISILKVLKKDDKWCLLFTDLTKQEPYRDFYVCVLDVETESKQYMGKITIEKDKYKTFGIDIQEKNN